MCRVKTSGLVCHSFEPLSRYALFGFRLWWTTPLWVEALRSLELYAVWESLRFWGQDGGTLVWCKQFQSALSRLGKGFRASDLLGFVTHGSRILRSRFHFLVAQMPLYSHVCRHLEHISCLWVRVCCWLLVYLLVHAYVHTYIHTYVGVHTNVYIYMYIYIHIYICT